jgi:PAS domain S-box-containing protein
MSANQDERLLKRYAAALKEYVSSDHDTAMEQAYDLGREAVRAGFGLLAMSAIHKEALVAALRDAPVSGDGARIAERAMDFFGESMGAFEMVYRGYQDANDALRRSEAQLRLLTDSLPVLITYVDRELRYRFANQTCETWYARPKDELIGRRLRDVVGDAAFEQLRPRVEGVLSGSPAAFQETITYPDGNTREVEVTFVPHVASEGTIEGFFALTHDGTDRKATEAQLRQAQKMEAVGQLTGGVAHDFNNLLTVVIGNLDAALERVPGDTRPLVDSALRAAERGATLIRKMLAFSRRQTLVPEALDLNVLAAGMEDLLRRTLGEQVEIEMKLSPDLWPTLADKAQVESALLNLAINSRDAMPTGGKLTIETANIRLDDDYGARNAEVVPGDYVVLAVTDTGGGMRPEVLARALEPFFTTKGVGKGSGLGLSMIYGFAKQSDGHLKIYSEVGHGTTVRLYLPRQVAQTATATVTKATPGDHPRGGETILVVEDDPLVRSFVVVQLRDLGYIVLEAADGPAAQKLLDDDASIDLLFTDVVMPGGMTGRQLADKAKRRRPGLRTLYTSGYTENSIVHQGKLDPGVHFLSKPFRRQDLAVKVRKLLDLA